MASDHETIFTMEATPVKFGAGASAEEVLTAADAALAAYWSLLDGVSAEIAGPSM